MTGIRATRAYIHLDNLLHNVEAVKKSIPDGTRICAAVKAGAYGHDPFLKIIPKLLRNAGVEYLGIATPYEGYSLYKSGDSGGKILLGPCTRQEIPYLLKARLEPMLTDPTYMKILESEIASSGTGPLKVHLKVDTGMGRVGCPPEAAAGFGRRIMESKYLELAGIATHFPVADSEDPEDAAFTRGQFEELLGIADEMRSLDIDPGLVHAANTGGIAIHSHLKTPHMMVRPGIALYGYGPPLPVPEPQRPVMEFRTAITALKKVKKGTSISYGRTWFAPEDTWIATLPVGYADGYPRLLSNKADVLIAGKRYPLAGTICMDQCMVNLGPATEAAVGDTVTLFGPAPGGPDAEELAGLIGTISYEITCGISSRVERVSWDLNTQYQSDGKRHKYRKNDAAE